MSAPSTIRLPPLEDLWPWPRAINTYLADVEQECVDWCVGFGAFKPETHGLIYEHGNFTLLAGMMLAHTSRVTIQTACDLMLLLFTFDDQADRSTPEEVSSNGEVLVDGLSYPEKSRPKGEWVGGEFGRQFWHRRLKKTPETFRRRFVQIIDDYVKSVVKEAEYRSQARILDMESYFVLRRLTIGAYPIFAALEMDLDIPDEVRKHPILRQLEISTIDLLIISNDIHSYNKEQAFGNGEHNIVTIIMKQYDMNVQQAINKAGELFREQADKFDGLYRQLPRWFGPVDLEVQKLVDGMGTCVGGNMHWSYECRRYFGLRGPEIKETRVVDLLPKAERGSKGNPSVC